jgi:maltose/moltooligosaccharide transporter
MSIIKRPNLSFWQIWNMSFGFLGIQYGFGLQQANLSPIFRYHGAVESELPILWLAGPVTGLLIQPLIGALSDRTWTRFGRRKPFFVMGALIGSIAVMLMPYVPQLWMVVGLFWILDAAMNTAMEPYRALVGDSLNTKQRTIGFSVQTFMIAAGQILAGLMPLIMLAFGVSDATDGNSIPDIVKYSFVIGCVALLGSVAWTANTTKEYEPENLQEILQENKGKNLFVSAVGEIWEIATNMPKAIKSLWWVKFFSWFGLPLMWQYLSLSIARHCFNAPTPESPGFAEGAANVGLALTVMNITTVVMSFMIPTVIRIIGARNCYALFLALGGCGFLSMQLTEELNMVLLGMVPVGIAWSAIITVPFILTTQSVPATKIGVYMGLLNAFICLPQIIEMLTIGSFYDSLLMGDPRNALALAGIMLVTAAAFVYRIPKESDVRGV